MKKNLILLAAVLSITACTKTSEVKVTNRVSNCKIENMSFGDYKISGSIITSETSQVTKIRDNKRNFPKKAALRFYMISKGNTVYLRTKQEYQLEKEGTLEIVLENSTEVEAP